MCMVEEEVSGIHVYVYLYIYIHDIISVDENTNIYARMHGKAQKVAHGHISVYLWIVGLLSNRCKSVMLLIKII